MKIFEIRNSIVPRYNYQSFYISFMRSWACVKKRADPGGNCFCIETPSHVFAFLIAFLYVCRCILLMPDHILGSSANGKDCPTIRFKPLGRHYSLFMTLSTARVHLFCLFGIRWFRLYLAFLFTQCLALTRHYCLFYFVISFFELHAHVSLTLHLLFCQLQFVLHLSYRCHLCNPKNK